MKRYSLNQHFSFVKNGINSDHLKAETNYDYNMHGFYQHVLTTNLCKFKSLIQEEIKKGTILEDICLKLGIKEYYMRYLLPWLQIKERPRPNKKRWNGKLRNLPSLSTQQRSIIAGGLLGDASRYCPSVKRSVQFLQSVKHAQYLRWKYNEMENIATKPPIIITYYHKVQKKNYSNIRFYTKSHPEIEKIINLFYTDKLKKTVTVECLDLIDELALAVWFMDDGTTQWCGHKGKSNPLCEICTECFSDVGISLLKEMLRKKFKIETHLSKRRRIQFNTINTNLLFCIIEKYIPECMKYKVNKEAHKKHLKERTVK